MWRSFVERVRKTLAMLGILGGLALMPTSAFSQTVRSVDRGVSPADKCAGLVNFQIPDSGMAITKAESVPTAPPNTIKPSPFSPSMIPVAVPSYCRAEGIIRQRTGAGGNPYAIGFAIALPDSWSGQFLFQGGGGLNGSVQPPYGTAAAGDTPALARGMAVVSTDSGHKGAVFDSSFMKDQQASLDFAQTAVGRVTVVAKAIIAHYYGQPARRSYFAGCSTGGREGMLASQRYPLYFDGVVSGDPAMNTGYSSLGLAWAAVVFNQIAPKDHSGKPVASQDYSPSDRKLLIDSLLEACDSLDGLKDGMIFNLQACHFDPAVLTCKGQKSGTCLTSQQVDALKSAFAGPKDSRGHEVYAPFPYDTGVGAESPNSIPGFLPSSSGFSPFPRNFSLQINVDEREAAADGDAMQRLTDTNLWTNLSTFSGHGGKLLFYHGDSDPWFSPLATFDYYNRLTQDNGGEEEVRGWSRLFFVPGMSHCGGGPATLDHFDLLSAAVDWVEKGMAPDFVVATGTDFPGRSRPLCAYPAYAHYKGQGNTEDAANFECLAGGPIR
jgi:feruloyl esterase